MSITQENSSPQKKQSTLKNFAMRMLLFALGGTLTVVTFNNTWNNHLIARIVFTMFILLMGIEFHYLIPKNNRPPLFLTIIATMLFPAFIFLDAYFNLVIINLQFFRAQEVYILFFIFLSFMIFRNTTENVFSKVKSLTFITIYISLFASYWMQIPDFKNATFHMYTITLAAYFIDGSAYLIGISLGRIEKKYRRKPLLTISPNKTITGYVGGLIGGICTFFGAYLINPLAFNYAIISTIILGLSITLAVILGDLFESAMKRELGKKDSGTLMLGRGGVLDTFDSLLFASPVYVILYKLLFL